MFLAPAPSRCLHRWWTCRCRGLKRVRRITERVRAVERPAIATLIVPLAGHDFVHQKETACRQQERRDDGHEMAPRPLDEAGKHQRRDENAGLRVRRHANEHGGDDVGPRPGQHVGGGRCLLATSGDVSATDDLYRPEEIASQDGREVENLGSEERAEDRNDRRDDECDAEHRAGALAHARLTESHGAPDTHRFAGERPTNPDLLEYLATYFRANGLSTKALHREILLSAVYQLSSEDSEANYAKDGANRYYWRANRHRMDAEQIRDSFLAAAGSLDEKLFGPSKDLTPDYKRRTIYGKVSRYHLDDYLQLFDFPSPQNSAEKRFSTSVPQQRLFFMNSDFAQQQGELLAARTAEEPDRAARIQKMYGILFGRAATTEEVQAGSST